MSLMMLALISACSKGRAAAETRTEGRTLGCMIDGAWRATQCEAGMDLTDSDTGEVTMRADAPRGPQGAEAGQASRRAR